MIRNENSSVIQLSRYKCQWQPVCCIGNSSNRLTPAQLQGSGGGWQTAALSVVISKGAKMPFQRQLGMAHWRGKVTSLAKVRHSPGVPHDASMSACSTKTINPTQCKEKKKKKYSIGEAERHSSFPEHKTSHLSTRRCRPCSESPGHQLPQPQLLCLATLGGQWMDFPICQQYTSFTKEPWGRIIQLSGPWNEAHAVEVICAMWEWGCIYDRLNMLVPSQTKVPCL